MIRNKDKDIRKQKKVKWSGLDSTFFQTQTAVEFVDQLANLEVQKISG